MRLMLGGPGQEANRPGLEKEARSEANTPGAWERG